MALNRELEGKVYPPVSLEVTRESIVSFAAAIGDPDSVYRSREAAAAAGLNEQIAPPTYTVVLQWNGIERLKADPELGLDFAKVLHGDQSFDLRRPVRAGDVLTASARITAIRGKGSMEALTIETDIKDAQGETVVVVRGTLIQREGT